MDLMQQIEEAAAWIQKKTKLQPRVGIILGTGLGALASEIAVEVVIPYSEIPHMPVSTVETHAGELVFGTLGGKIVVAMKGRFHIYEGYSAQQVTFPVRVMKALGVDILLISNACGGMNPEFKPGDLMVLEDHINLLGVNPLIGPNDDRLGPRWPDMIEPYSTELIQLAQQCAADLKMMLRKGVYVAVTGPNLETRAEYRMLGQYADVVGMSTVPEVIAAVHAGMKTLGISVITDACQPDTLKPVNIEEIIKIAGEAEPKLTRLMATVIERIS